MTEKCKMVDDQLEQVSGGAGEEKKYYCVEGYSKAYGGNVKLYVSTYNDAVKLCEKLGLGQRSERGALSIPHRAGFPDHGDLLPRPQ